MCVAQAKQSNWGGARHLHTNQEEDEIELREVESKIRHFDDVIGKTRMVPLLR